MVVYFPVIIVAKVVNVCMKKNFHKREKKIEDKPDVHHFDVGGFWKIVWNIDEHRGQDKHTGEIDRDHGFEEKRFEEIGDMPNQIQEDSWKVNSEKNSK